MNHSQFLISGFLRPPFYNGVGRQINQLQRLTIKFCKSHGGSKGMRDFIENHLVNYAKENQSVVVSCDCNQGISLKSKCFHTFRYMSSQEDIVPQLS